MRPPPGEQVSVGRIRVDATRAIAKLREFQLADRAAWALDVVRAAVAGGATEIDVAGDADDVWIAWRGPPLAVDDLPRLFDELVSPDSGADRYHVRLLASGLNSALGMAPWFADVYAVPGGRVRYTPDSYDEDGLRRLVVEPDLAPPRDGAELAGDGMMVHVRKRGAFEIAARFLSRALPPELVKLAATCRDMRVPIRIAGKRHHRDESNDLVRVPLGDGLDGWLAITDTADTVLHAGRLVLAEHGVRLDVLSLDIVAEPRGHVPIRAFVDAPRLPTNASRSGVREDVHPVTTAKRRAVELLPRAIDLLLVLARGTDERAARARRSATVLLASVLHGQGLAWLLPGRPFVALGEAPLLRDAAGVPRSAAHDWSCVYVAEEPVDAALGPWVASVLWVPDPELARALLGGVDHDAISTKLHLRSAKRMAKLNARFFAHAPKEPTVVARRPPRIRLALGPAGDRFPSAVHDAVFAGMRGEVCVYAEPHPRNRSSEIVLTWQGRELERVPFASTIAFDAVIDAQDFAPGERYRSVVRDATFQCAIAAMRGGLCRAIEMIARECKRGDARDAALVRDGIALALAHGFEVATGSLIEAPVWPCTDDTWRSLAQLREARVIGTTPPGTRLVRPMNRPVVRVEPGTEATTLARLCPTTAIVHYAHDAEAIDAVQLAAALGGRGAFCALAMPDLEPGTLAVILPSGTPQRLLLHRGTGLATDEYHPEVLPCAIAIDSDAFVPTDDWSGLRDDAGQRAHDFRAWEIALVHALWGAIAGQRPANLIGDPIDFGSPIADVACAALAGKAFQIALEPALVAKLRTVPVIEVLGDPVPHSLDELVAAGHLARDVPYAAPGSIPVDGVFAIHAPAVRARAIAALMQLDLRDVGSELVKQRATAARRAALAIHRTKPPQPIALPPTKIAVPIASPIATGEVALGEEGTDIHVLCEGRELARIRENGWPLVAVVDVAEASVDDAFATLEREALNAVRFAVIDAAISLMLAIAARDPAQLAGEAFPLVAMWCVGERALDRRVRDALFAAPAFATIQGERVSLERAVQANGAIAFATWEQPWLPPLGDRGDPETAYDTPILRAGTRTLHFVIGRLHGNAKALGDVTEEVRRLQHQRRVARGLVPTPVLAAIPAAHKCKIADLGPDAVAAFGHGEIGLSPDTESFAQIYVNGTAVQMIPLNVVPRVDLAFESTDKDRGALGANAVSALEARVQQLAPSLLWKLLPGMSPLTPAIRRSIFAAAASGVIDRVVRSSLEVAELANGAFVALAMLDDQIAKYGNAWSVTTAAAAQRAKPLSDQRLVFRTTPDVLERANAANIPLIDATEELALDARAIANRALPKRKLAIDVATLAHTELPGDGITESRILVGLLDPARAGSALVWATRDGSPFQPRVLAAGCAWPTVAAVEDPRFVPDRTWDHAVMDATWERAMTRIREASAQLHAWLGGKPPANALISCALDADLLWRCDLPKDPQFVIAGLTWLDREPVRDLPISVSGAPALVEFGPASPVRARLFPYGRTGGKLQEIVDRVGAAAHSALLRALIASDADPQNDAVAAHLAIGLALRRIDFTEVKLAGFPCFAPEPLSPGQLLAMLHGKTPVHVYHEQDRGLGRGLVDDGSQLARVVKHALGTRAVIVPPGGFPSMPAPMLFRRVVTPSVVVAPEALTPKPAALRPIREQPKPPPPHPLAPIADALQRRLGELAIALSEVHIDTSAKAPLLVYDNALHLGGNDARAHAILALKRAGDPRYREALDLLAAHAVTLLNVALASVTDATEGAAITRLLGDA